MARFLIVRVSNFQQSFAERRGPEYTMLEQSNNSSLGSSEEECPPRKPRSFIQDRIEITKDALKTLADENNALFGPEPLAEEFLHYPSDAENPQNEELEKRMVDEFKAQQPPEGGDSSEECYTYLLLDPRVTSEIQWDDATPEEKWRTFVRSIFFVEKGQSALPNDHLRDAYNFLRSAKNGSSEITNAGKRMQRILQIWSEDEGVILLKAFQFINSAEAHTRQAVIIETLGLSSLCNEILGTHHDGGVVENLNPDQKSSFGKYLLLKAMSEYINSEEIKIFPRLDEQRSFFTASSEERLADHEEEFAMQDNKDVRKTLDANKSLDALNNEDLGFPTATEISDNEETLKKMLPKWREADENRKCCTYLLLTHSREANNKIKWDDATPEDKLEFWTNFVQRIFFVGKGQDSSHHIKEAEKPKASKEGKTVASKILHFWSEDKGVIVLEVFESITSDEAQKMKTFIHDTLEDLLKIYKNEGGVVEKLELYQNFSFGKYLLFKAMKKFLDSTIKPVFAPNKNWSADGSTPSHTEAGSSKTEINKQTPPKKKDENKNADPVQDLTPSLNNISLTESKGLRDVESKSDAKMMDMQAAPLAFHITVRWVCVPDKNRARPLQQIVETWRKNARATPVITKHPKNNCLSPPPAVGNISVRLEETTPGKSDGDQSIARDENNDDDANSPEEPRTRPRTRRARIEFIKERIEVIKDAMETLAKENEPLIEELLDYPSDEENLQNEKVENNMINVFEERPPFGMTWIGGNGRNCCTYLLLDPRVITFVSSIFYVGKGQNMRPYEHLHIAYDILMTAKYVKSRISKAGKNIQRILQIWSENKGVIVLKAFQLMISAEAHTREAVIIETLQGLPSLCNKNCGTYYDENVKEFDDDQKSSFGKYLLLKAMEEYEDSDKIKIFPVNIG
ncbi:Hypothetical predicted protein [Cloeon dipterum]|uniref:Uncharacterized protein n=1 Tax=Cloeon dipterum TaxID=197152 RepID=A0A8S1CLG3_9INSE|nr:Hypothetical predicted protein [Cloeon dipterum]